MLPTERTDLNIVDEHRVPVRRFQMRAYVIKHDFSRPAVAGDKQKRIALELGGWVDFCRQDHAVNCNLTARTVGGRDTASDLKKKNARSRLNSEVGADLEAGSAVSVTRAFGTQERENVGHSCR